MLLLVTAILAVVSELLPVFLSNIPFQLTQTHMTHVVCTHLTLAILVTMVLVLAVSMFVRWPHMPVDPCSVAGAAYYVADSAMLSEMTGCGLATKHPGQLRGHFRGLGQCYFYGLIDAASGRARMVVDSVSDAKEF